MTKQIKQNQRKEADSMKLILKRNSLVKSPLHQLWAWCLCALVIVLLPVSSMLDTSTILFARVSNIVNKNSTNHISTASNLPACGEVFFISRNARLSKRDRRHRKASNASLGHPTSHYNQSDWSTGSQLHYPQDVALAHQ